jgi:hypothetical protein
MFSNVNNSFLNILMNNMPKMTKDEKKAYHKRYYRANAIRLQALARVRYWNLVYKFKDAPQKKTRKKN